MQRPKVVLVYPLPDPSGDELLRSRAHVVRPASEQAASLAEALKDADAIVLRGPARLTAELIDGSPRLKVIGAVGSGTDNIDVGAATRRGIPVVHGAGVAPRAVAEYVLGAMVAAHRGFRTLHASLVDGNVQWQERVRTFAATELTGTSVGIIGYGHIGRVVGRLVRTALDAHVLAYDPLIASDPDDGTELVDDLGRLLDESKTVTIHVPLLPSTHGLLGADELRRIGSDGVLVNASRGGIVEEAALVRALETGELKAAAVDVFDDEPPTGEQIARLAAAPNLMLTPHVAGVTDQALGALSRSVAQGVLDVLGGDLPSNLVNGEELAARVAGSPGTAVPG